MEAVERSSNIRVIVDADHYPPFAPTHEIGHALIFLERKIKPIASSLPVRRVHVEERVRPVVTFGAGEPGQVFDIGPGKPLPSGGRILLDAQQGDGRPCRRGTERLPGDFATERVLLEVEESRSTLDIGQGLGARHLLPLEYLARAKRPLNWRTNSSRWFCTR
ncbi:hypothetical protein D3C81_479200 [compost metagenome]